MAAATIDSAGAGASGPSPARRPRMIYLADRRLLFLKPMKVAGTSVEIALSCNAGPGDIVTPIAAGDEVVRHEAGGQFPVNWAWLPGAEAAYRRNFDAYLGHRKREKRRLWPGKRQRLYNRWLARYYNHITPAALRWRAPKGLVEGAFLVSIVRHPYDQTVSLAHHKRRHRKQPVEGLIDRILAGRPDNEAFLFGPRRPDFVIRYEHLAEDLATLEARFGLTLNASLPVTKSGARPERRPAAETLTQAQRARCRALYARTFEAFGYEG